MRTPDFRYPLGTAFLFIAGLSAPPQTPQAAVDELLAADRRFAAASAQTDMITGLTAMFADDIVMPIPGGRFATGIGEVRAGYEATPENKTRRVEWAPVRGGISADGRHGFTFGYMTMTGADKSVVPFKYLSYWVKGAEGWKVAVYRRSRRPEGDVSPTMMPAALPPLMVSPVSDAAAVEAHRASLDQAERSFSDEAQKVGLGPAFVKYGSADAVNMGGQESLSFVVGSEAIGRAVSQGEPATGGSSVSWGPDRTIVATSGDLGVTIGMIRLNKPDPTRPSAGFAFFTIWRRNSTSEPWRYVAE